MPIKPATFRPAVAKRPQDESVRLSSYVRGYGGRAWRMLRMQVYTRDAGVCQSCKRTVGKAREAHIDHIKPKARGGADELSNLQTLCASCHSKKTREEARSV